MPIKAGGATRIKAFFIAVLSGIVEPIGAALMIIASALFLPLLPYVLGFAAGAMVFAVVEDLMPSDCHSTGKTLSSLTFCIGFIIMIILDVSLG
jgi:ZIP family zinc transporter